MKNALVTITVAFLFCSTLMAQGDNEISRESLKGLSGVNVVVEDISTFASTWSFGRTGIVGASYLNGVRDDVKDGVDKLINAWLSVNPKH